MVGISLVHGEADMNPVDQSRIKVLIPGGIKGVSKHSDCDHPTNTLAIGRGCISAFKEGNVSSVVQRSVNTLVLCIVIKFGIDCLVL